MNGKYYTIKIAAIITTLVSVLLYFCGWITIDTSQNVTRADKISLMNLSDIFTEKDDITGTSFIDGWANQIYEGYLPSLQAAPTQEEANALIDDMDADITLFTMLLLVPCGIVKFLLLLSLIFAVYGIVRSLIMDKRSKFIMASQIISLLIQAGLYLIILIFSFVDITVGSLRLNDLVVLLPTYWMIFATVMSVVSLLLYKYYQKEYLPAPIKA